jgi:hemolysin activation/secretion protein
MFLKTFVLGLFLATSLAASTIPSIDKIDFEGNLKIPTKKLNALVNPYIGKPMNEQIMAAIANEVEFFYRKNNFELAHASVKKTSEHNKSITIRIEKYADFDARAVGEMKRRAIKPNTINQIFFLGNEKISTQRLIKLVEPSLGLESTPDNLKALVLSVQDYYRKHRYELAYAEIEKSDERGIITVAIKKYPNFKARYAKEGK